jgi:hypothetical protein
MATKKAMTSAIKPSPKAAKAAKELRAETNNLSDTAREQLFHKGMQLIYGGGNKVQAIPCSR